MRKKLIYLLILWTILLSSTQAEVVVLRSGQQIKGEILLNNDEVIILRKKDGLRHQIPKAEVQSIQNKTTDPPTTDTVAATKKVAIRITATGGLAYIPHQGWGGTTEENLMIGTHNLLDKQIFLGGSIGFRGVFSELNQYTWFPLQIATYLPITTKHTSRHRPIVGAAFGYAFSANKQADGGLCAGIDFGYWYRFNHRSSIAITFTAQWQQTSIDIVENIQQTEYINRIGCNIIGIGLKANIQF